MRYPTDCAREVRKAESPTHRERAHEALNHGVQYVGYVSDEGIRGEWYNTTFNHSCSIDGARDRRTTSASMMSAFLCAPLNSTSLLRWNIWLTGIRSPRQRASVDPPPPPQKKGHPVVRARWAAHQKVDNLHSWHPRELWIDTEPLWEGRLPRARGGTKAKQQRERDDHKRQEEEAAHSSSFSSTSQTSAKATQEERLNSLLGGIRPGRPYFRIALSVALTYEDTYVGRGKEKGLECCSLARVIDEYRQMGSRWWTMRPCPACEWGDDPVDGMRGAIPGPC